MKSLNRLAPDLDGNEYWMIRGSDWQATGSYETVREKVLLLVHRLEAARQSHAIQRTFLRQLVLVHARDAVLHNQANTQ
jgi:hypothetical protein